MTKHKNVNSWIHRRPCMSNYNLLRFQVWNVFMFDVRIIPCLCLLPVVIFFCYRWVSQCSVVFIIGSIHVYSIVSCLILIKHHIIIFINWKWRSSFDFLSFIQWYSFTRWWVFYGLETPSPRPPKRTSQSSIFRSSLDIQKDGFSQLEIGYTYTLCIEIA